MIILAFDGFAILLFLVLVALLVGYFIFTRSHLGRNIDGKDMTRSVIGSEKKGKKYIIKDLIIPTPSGNKKIDFAVVNENGIVAFISASIHGHLNGRENEEEWFSRSNFKGTITYFDNPVKKAKFITKALESFFPNIKIYTVVVFFDGNLYNVHTDTLTIYPRNCHQALKALQSKEKLNEEEIIALGKKVKDLALENQKLPVNDDNNIKKDYEL